jgi:bacterioferritin-associated ferredoxin
MMVCLCNHIKDGHVKAAIQAGAKKPADVFKLLGVQRACGQCLETIETMISETIVREVAEETAQTSDPTQ